MSAPNAPAGSPGAAVSACPHCGSGLLWSEDRGAHCDGCDEFDPEPDLSSNSPGSATTGGQP